MYIQSSISKAREIKFWREFLYIKYAGKSGTFCWCIERLAAAADHGSDGKLHTGQRSCHVQVRANEVLES